MQTRSCAHTDKIHTKTICSASLVKETYHSSMLIYVPCAPAYNEVMQRLDQPNRSLILAEGLKTAISLKSTKRKTVGAVQYGLLNIYFD